MTVQHRTTHIKTDRKVTNPKRERTQRMIVRRAIDLADFDALPTRVSTRELRTIKQL